MIIQTAAYYMGKQNLHSSKTGKDFIKFSLVIDGSFASFIVPAKFGEGIVKEGAKVFEQFEKTHAPIPCKAEIDLAFTERGNFTSLVRVAG